MHGSGVALRGGDRPLGNSDSASIRHVSLTVPVNLISESCTCFVIVDRWLRACAIDAAPSFDVGSLGVVLFELCSGRTLFAQDINNDELIEVADKKRLCAWHTIIVC